MHKPSIGLSLEGMPFIFLTTVATLTFAILDCWFMATLLLVVLFLVLNFFRDPERVVPQEPGVAVSPADGKVIKVETMRDPLTGEDRTAVCVFMNVFNVHVNRMPVAGRIARISYFGGKFINASFDKASTDNERNAVLVEDAEGKTWTMVQIAGLIARRIISWAEEGDSLARGQRFGLIKFGSRVDLYLPSDYESVVRIGEKVFAGQTVLARKKR
ncbi:Phosphatidylserine decarboxylase proenzyme [anaerobic digester metagenome]